MKIHKRHTNSASSASSHKINDQVDVARLPIDGRTGQPMVPQEQPGYYPGFHTLDQQKFWDEATRKVVLNRVNGVPPIRFFTTKETLLMQAVCDRLIPQDDRDLAHKVPIVNHIDDKLYNGRIPGYRYESMPPESEAIRLGLQAIEAIAQHIYGRSFTELDGRAQDHVLMTIHDGNPPAAEEIWRKMSVKHFWGLLLDDAIEAYYAHPYAWDEIGFGGPAYPRGYMRLEGGKPEPWEVNEQRYVWQAPPDSLSDVYNYPDVEEKLQHSGQGGTH